jgi:5-methylcytosine-specific restriction endonuclease McrA
MKKIDCFDDMDSGEKRDFIMLNRQEFKTKYGIEKPEIIKCPIKRCNKRFVNLKGVKSHTKQVHNISLSCESERKTSKNWEENRQKTIERDNYRCRLCGTKVKESTSEVHHIIPKRTFEKEEGDFLENLVTLCEPCHHSIESNAPLEFQKKIFRQSPELFL